ncbi:MAG: hypothetical protein Roseis2KO_26590 [Roseivirga sp.]
MKPFIFLLLTGLCLFGCSPRVITQVYVTNTDIFGDLNESIPQNDSLVVKMNGRDTVSVGSYAISKDGDLSIFKTGIWKEYREGKLRAKGEYKMGNVTDCCAGGQCMAYYHYRIGEWTYYKPTGEVKFKLDFQPEAVLMRNRCGDQFVQFGLVAYVDRTLYKYQLSSDTIFELQKVEMEGAYGKTIITPLNGRLFFDSIQQVN